MNIRNSLANMYDFYLVAKEKSFTVAAKKYCLAQPNLSKSVQNLEDELHLKLINRSNKGITLTSDGEKLFEQLDKNFNSIESYSKNLFSDELSGNLIIGTTRNIADNKLCKFLNIFSKNYPKVKIKIITDSAKNLNEYLLNHKIDILIDYLPQINFSEKDDMAIKSFDKFNTCFACSKNYYEEIENNIKSLKDLSKYNLVIPGSSRRRQYLDEFLQTYNVKLKPNIEMPDSKLMADFIKQNNYIGYFIEDEAITNDLKILNLKEKMPLNSIGVIYSKSSINNIAKKFVELLLNNN